MFATERSWEDGGGEPVRHEYKLCLVLSRPCAAIHKPHVVVAGIGKYVDNVPRKVESLEEVAHFLTGMRDGWRTPDLFYLGQLPGRDGRFCARFDAIFSIQVPSDPENLADFVKSARIGSLNVEFLRDLHLRVFGAFASLGFSDQGWLSDGDLKWVVETGRGELSAAETKLQQERAKKAGQEAKGERFNEEELAKSERKVAELKTRLQPYLDEWQSRGMDSNGGQSESEDDVLGDSVTT